MAQRQAVPVVPVAVVLAAQQMLALVLLLVRQTGVAVVVAVPLMRQVVMAGLAVPAL